MNSGLDGMRTEVPVISEMSLNILRSFCITCLCEVVSLALTTLKSNIYECLKTLSMLYTLQYQIVSPNKQAQPQQPSC